MRRVVGVLNTTNPLWVGDRIGALMNLVQEDRASARRSGEQRASVGSFALLLGPSLCRNQMIEKTTVVMDGPVVEL